jgi:hypothetical protein
MNHFLKISFLSMAFALGSAHDSMAAPQKMGASEPISESKAPEAKPGATRQEFRQKRKEERLKKLLERCEADIKTLETKVNGESGVLKKKLTLNLSHAKLEAEAAKDPDLEQSVSFHIRQCKRYLFRAKDILEGKELNIKQDEQKPQKN